MGFASPVYGYVVTFQYEFMIIRYPDAVNAHIVYNVLPLVANLNNVADGHGVFP